MIFARVCCLSLATVSLSVGIAAAQVPPVPYCPTGANSQSEQFAGRPAAASGSGLAGGHAGIARRIRIQRIRNGRVPARHQRGSQSAAQCAAPFPSTPARSALNQFRRFRAQAPPSKERQPPSSQRPLSWLLGVGAARQPPHCFGRDNLFLQFADLGAELLHAVRSPDPHWSSEARLVDTLVAESQARLRGRQ